jgi:Holliday junction resolvase RusA-like endonuclease
VKIKIKPLSVNDCWRGRRMKTEKYLIYESKLKRLLPPLELPPPPFSVYYEFGFSSLASDLDNPIKPLQDILQKKYKFDDKLIFEFTARKKKVKKGDEYIILKINSFIE